jgi:GAF domain-containing protein
VTERRRSQAAEAILAEVGARVAAATDYSTTLQEMAQAVVPSFADYCVIDLANEGFERAAFAHRTAAGRAILEKTLPFPLRPESHLGEAFRTGQPLLIEEIHAADLDAFAQSPEHRDALGALAPRSLIVAPLVARAHALGLMAFARTDASRQLYSSSDLELAADLGRRAGSAVERARLQRDLERAVRARDDTLAVVAHDLRNPIATIAFCRSSPTCSATRSSSRPTAAISASAPRRVTWMSHSR